MRKHPVLGRIAGYAFAIVFILAGWQFTAMAVHNPVLPGPFDAFPMVAQYFDELWPAFLVSLYRVVVAMLIGTVLAIPLGLACGRSPRAAEGRAAACAHCAAGFGRRAEDCAHRDYRVLPSARNCARCIEERA